MKKRILRMPVLAVCALALVAGTAFAAVKAAPPSGEPAVPGVGYAPAGVGAPYLSTSGAPRRLSGAGIGQFGGALQAKATTLGTKAGTAMGKKVTKPLGLKVGYLDIIGGIESADRADNAMRNAFKHLGAKWLYCDGAGNPQKWVTCGQSLLAQGANVIALTGIDPSTIPSVVTAAKAKGVPIVDCCGTVGPGFSAQFAPDESYNGQVLAAYLKAKLGTSSTSKVLVVDYPAPWATQRSAQLVALSKKVPQLDIIQTLQTDPTNLVAGTQKSVGDVLTANPDIKAIWVSFDTVGQVVGQVVSSKYPGKEFPAKPLVVTFHADPSTQPLLKSGAIDAVVDNNYDGTAWEAADATAEFFARKTAFPPYTVAAKYPGIGNPMVYQIVTGKNLPPKNTYVRPNVDVASYFIAKWKAEGFGK